MYILEGKKNIHKMICQCHYYKYLITSLRIDKACVCHLHAHRCPDFVVMSDYKAPFVPAVI